jgi:hypothetical protein
MPVQLKAVLIQHYMYYEVLTAHKIAAHNSLLPNQFNPSRLQVLMLDQ